MSENALLIKVIQKKIYQNPFCALNHCKCDRIKCLVKSFELVNSLMYTSCLSDVSKAFKHFQITTDSRGKKVDWIQPCLKLIESNVFLEAKLLVLDQFNANV